MIKRGKYFVIFKNKRADSLIFPIVIFIVLNLVFFGILLIFVYKSSTGVLVYEQVYANQIALMIDSAKPSSEIIIDFKKGIEVAEGNKIISKENLVKIKDGKLTVKLSTGKGYSYNYFSDYDMNSYFNEDKLVIIIDEKEKTG